MRRCVALLLLAAGCAPAEDQGTSDEVFLSKPREVVKPGPDASPATDEEDAGVADPTPDPDPEPPSVEHFGPTSGPYGTEIVIQGMALGSATQEDVILVLETSDQSVELSPDSTPEVVSWSDVEIRVRFPFPLGPATFRVVTEVGEIEAGEFSPTWAAGPAWQVPDGSELLAAVSTAPDQLTALVAAPLQVVQFDADAAQATEVSAPGIQQDSARLYLDEAGQVQGVALSNASPPELIAIQQTAGAWSATATGIIATAEFAIAGGSDGAAVWFRDGNNDWFRAVPVDGTWSTDLGPIADPAPSAARHDAATASDGTLFIGYAKETGTLLDDRGAPYVRTFDEQTSSFLSERAAGSQVDDSVSVLTLQGRGSGVLLTYQGDESGQPVRVAPIPALGTPLKNTPPESDSLRYGFNAGVDAPVGVAYCSPDQGTRAVLAVNENYSSSSGLDAESGDVVVWPCADVWAAEFDSGGQLLVLVKAEDQLYLPRPLDE